MNNSVIISYYMIVGKRHWNNRPVHFLGMFDSMEYFWNNFVPRERRAGREVLREAPYQPTKEGREL